MNISDERVLTIQEYAKELYNQLRATLGTDSNIIPEGFPISRGTLYNMKNGKNITTDTIKKSCEYLNIPEPKIIF